MKQTLTPSIHQRRLKSQLGVTLVELLIYMALLMGFLTLLSGVFVSTLEVQSASIDTARIEQDSQYLFSRLEYDLGRSTAIITPVNNGDTDPTLEIVTAAGNLIYFAEAGQLKLATATGEEILTSPGIAVTSLSFQRLGDSGNADSIRILLDLERTDTSSSHPESRQLIYTLGVR